MTNLLQNIKKLPDLPGVYFFKDKSGKILYIGKATSLRDRVKSYFNKDIFLSRGPLIEKMLFETSDVKFEKTDSVLEALILEANLIKKYQPRYNSMGKDDKSWNYVAITSEDFPRIILIRSKELQTTNYKLQAIFGPFPHSGQLIEALRIIRKIFPFRDQKSKNLHTERFYQQIGLAPDVSSKEAQKEYLKNIRNIKLFFDGKKQKIIKLLEQEMNREVKKQNFENAGKVKNKIFSLKHIQDVAILKTTTSSKSSSTNYRIEAYDVAHISGKFVVGAMTVLEQQELKKSDYRKFEIKISPGINDISALREILNRRLNHKEWTMPNLIVVDGGIAQKRVAESTLKENKLNIPVVAVTKDERHKPKHILGDRKFIENYEQEILKSNAEAHRFALSYHKKLRDKIK